MVTNYGPFMNFHKLQFLDKGSESAKARESNQSTLSFHLFLFFDYVLFRSKDGGKKN